MKLRSSRSERDSCVKLTVTENIREDYVFTYSSSVDIRGGNLNTVTVLI